jgi:aspartate 1-decarboxylase
MLRSLLQAKIHRCTVTDAHLDYIGSIAIDADLLNASGIIEYQEVQVWNVTNGERFATYAIEAPRGSGTISVNGSAARRVQIGDVLIVAAFSLYTDADIAAGHSPKKIFVDAQNQIVPAPSC